MIDLRSRPGSGCAIAVDQPGKLRGTKDGAGAPPRAPTQPERHTSGQGWKVSPCVHIEGHTTHLLAAIDGPALITHIWLTTYPR